MGHADLAALLPLIITAAAPLAIMVTIAFTRSHAVTFALTVFALLQALWALAAAGAVAPRRVGALLAVDGPALLSTGVILATTLVVAALAFVQLRRREERPEEFYLLLLAATAGALVLVAATHVASLVLGLEILSTALYALIAYRRPDPRGVEAGVKYLILAAVSLSCLLFGAGLLYFEGGTLELSRMAAALAGDGVRPAVAAAGAALVAVGVGFKLSLAPLHLWAPDVFEGAPEAVTAYVATVSKGAAFVALFRVAGSLDPATAQRLAAVLGVLAVASMLVGNLQALRQDDPRRLLACSSIAHMGYLTVAFLAAGPRRFEVFAFALIAYVLATLASFGALAIVAGHEGGRGSRHDLRGLFRRRPFAALVLAAGLLSLAGLPLTAGFIAKVALLGAGVESGLGVPVGALIAGSVIGLFYYLRVIGAMLGEAPPGTEPAAPAHPGYGYALLAALTTLLFWVGVAPAWLQGVVRNLAQPAF
jgi:NADH-quinone oxidoreductase subunit N